MEIHPPAGPIESVREFLLHLSMIIIGILIALGLETTVEAFHHKALVREAKQNLINEIADNCKELDRGLAQVSVDKDQLNHMLNLIKGERRWRGTSRTAGDTKLGFEIITLHATSWDTAHDAGALTYMPYPEVKRFTELYGMQEHFLKVQDQTMTKWLDVQRVAYSLDKNMFTRFTDQELSDLQYEITGALSYIAAETKAAGVLRAEYLKFSK